MRTSVDCGFAGGGEKISVEAISGLSGGAGTAGGGVAGAGGAGVGVGLGFAPVLEEAPGLGLIIPGGAASAIGAPHDSQNSPSRSRGLWQNRHSIPLRDVETFRRS